MKPWKNPCSGSCRDSAWLLVQILREFGLAARFVSGYLIQLTADQEALDGPSGTAVDFTDLHAWTGRCISPMPADRLSPHLGMLASEGHSAGLYGVAVLGGARQRLHRQGRGDLEHEMTITRIHEDPRVTKPYSDEDQVLHRPARPAG